MVKQTLRQSLFFLLAAVVCAIVSNGTASNDRKLSWIGRYPKALEVPKQDREAQAVAGRDGQIPENPGPSETPRSQRVEARPPAPPQSEPQMTPQPVPENPSGKRGSAASTQEAWNLYLQHALFLDARRSEDYAAGHIAGARSFSVWEGDIDFKLQHLAAEGIPPDFPIVTYCSGGECEDSAILAEKLADLGFNRVYDYRGGYPEWQELGRPVEGGPER